MSKVIGITGGIGSGKSLVCKVFSVLGIPIYEADARAKYLISHDQLLKKSIIELLGEQAYLASGDYNRAWVASQVFGNPILLSKLNALVHPKVRQDATDWIQRNQQTSFVLYEAALMKAAGDGNTFDKVIVVNAPVDLRIQRIKVRDQRSEAEIRAIIERQISEEERRKIADFTIENDEKQPLLPQILDLYEKLQVESD
ncbi:dephospho-CoA kinase [Arcicella rigui]|uniref:Dephospho-CoA kinase n=1 Tax=Arcicella rigui TaxID=797020 RepID=A0ABU5QGM7_9BACT|nr:dephospho-CoA kinase [Arcicella rigui]MEA5141908.1 dephospho-CoA kinase [Arcicella rigui]